MEVKALSPTARDLYDSDFFEWALHNARLLRARRLNEADLEHIAEELEDMGRRERRELASRLEILLAHLLKWQVQRGRRSSSRKATITLQRRKTQRLLKEMPSLRRALTEDLPVAYQDAILTAGAETRLGPEAFPSTCPFTLEQVLDAGFFPE